MEKEIEYQVFLYKWQFKHITTFIISVVSPPQTKVISNKIRQPPYTSKMFNQIQRNRTIKFVRQLVVALQHLRERDSQKNINRTLKRNPPI